MKRELLYHSMTQSTQEIISTFERKRIQNNLNLKNSKFTLSLIKFISGFKPGTVIFKQKKRSKSKDKVCNISYFGLF